MTKLTVRKSRVRALRRPWVVRHGPKVLGAFPSGADALTFLRRLLSAAHQ